MKEGCGHCLASHESGGAEACLQRVPGPRHLLSLSCGPDVRNPLDTSACCLCSHDHAQREFPERALYLYSAPCSSFSLKDLVACIPLLPRSFRAFWVQGPGVTCPPKAQGSQHVALYVRGTQQVPSLVASLEHDDAIAHFKITFLYKWL